MSFAARFFASPFSRCARTISNKRISACLQAVPCQRRGIFGFGKSSPTATPLSEDELAARAKHLTQELMKKPEWKKITTHAGAMNAIQNLVTVFGKKGIDIGSGKPPSLTEMMKLAADAEFREAVTLMKLEMKNAGVDMENPEFIKSLMSMQSPPKP